MQPERIKQITQAVTLIYLGMGIAFMVSGTYFFLNAIQAIKTIG